VGAEAAAGKKALTGGNLSTRTMIRHEGYGRSSLIADFGLGKKGRKFERGGRRRRGEVLAGSKGTLSSNKHISGNLNVVNGRKNKEITSHRKNRKCEGGRLGRVSRLNDGGATERC